MCLWITYVCTYITNGCLCHLTGGRDDIDDDVSVKNNSTKSNHHVQVGAAQTYHTADRQTDRHTIINNVQTNTHKNPGQVEMWR